jgi:hypothetical protein
VTCDVMHVNEIPFLITISRQLHFITLEAIAKKSTRTISNIIDRVQNLYRIRGVRIAQAHMDGEFEASRGILATLDITLNIVNRNKHVPEVEHAIWTVKEHCRCIFHSVPFPRFPQHLIIEMVSTAVFWLNAFPQPNKISHKYSPQIIVTGQHIVSWNLARMQKSMKSMITQ